jgi:ABC-2 type transport system ATP-binding protein
MSEMAVSADQIIVIGRGRFITAGSVDELTASANGSVLVRTTAPEKLRSLLTAATAIETLNDGALSVAGLTSEAIGELAFANGIILHELTPQRASLEEVFMDLTADAVEYGHHTPEVNS